MKFSIKYVSNKYDQIRIFKSADLVTFIGQILNGRLHFLSVKVQVVTLTKMSKSSLRQDLHMNLMETTQNIPWTCTQKINLLWKELCCFNDLPDERYTIDADDEVPINCKYPLPTIKADQTNTTGLAKLFKSKIAAKVILTVNLDIQYCLIIAKLEILVILDLLKVLFKRHMLHFLTNKLAWKQWDNLILAEKILKFLLKNVNLRFQ